ncbi:archaellin/type IV pilin N-terminal domain-containing protein, partial [Clostridium perfringens]
GFCERTVLDMRFTDALARARGRVKDRIAAPQRRAAAELIGTLLLVALVVCVAVAVNEQQRTAS